MTAHGYLRATAENRRRVRGRMRASAGRSAIGASVPSKSNATRTFAAANSASAGRWVLERIWATGSLRHGCDAVTQFEALAQSIALAQQGSVGQHRARPPVQVVI